MNDWKTVRLGDVWGGEKPPPRAHFVGRYPLCGGHPRNAPPNIVTRICSQLTLLTE